ncbi:MAG TPA: MDR family MFS transporter, partial [Chloroflexota bacterium]|nr:MDR family MFS transporter [Chloroflexota bacterium]
MSVSASSPIASVQPAEFSLRDILGPLVAIVLGTIMAILDATVVNVALPTLERVFAVDLGTMQWVITGYLLAQAAVIPLAGWLSDRFSARRIYLIALVLFAVGSALCALATSASFLIGFRVLQGLGGGMLQPVGMAILYRLAPPERRGQVMGVFGIPILIGPALGPVLSGWLVQYADWRYIFLLNLPVAVVALVLGRRALPRLPAQGKVGALDTVGAIVGPVGFSAITFGISQSTTAGWTGASTLAGIGIGMVALAIFALRELTATMPLLDLHVFRRRVFVLAILTSWVSQIAMFGSLFLVPLFLQQVRGYGSFTTGLATLPQSLVAAVFMPIGGRLFDRFGVRLPVLSGLVLVVVSLWQLSRLSVTTTPIDLIVPLSLWGAGLGLMLMPLNTYLLNAAPRALVSRVTALTGALGTVVGSLAIASFATIYQGRTDIYVSAGISGGLPSAMAQAFDETFVVAAIIGASSLILAVLLPPRPPELEAIRQLAEIGLDPVEA